MRIVDQSENDGWSEFIQQRPVNGSKEVIVPVEERVHRKKDVLGS